MDGLVIDSVDLLKRLEEILESDPFIDEVGYIHPSQFDSLREAACNSPTSISSDSHSYSPYFWSCKHKLGISTLILLPLHDAAKSVFMDAFTRCKMLWDSHVPGDESLNAKESKFSKSDLGDLESEVMKHSRALLLLSCDFGTAWNSRKAVISRKLNLPLLMNELLLSALVLSNAPKSERAWTHRRWVIKTIAANFTGMQEIVERDSELVKRLVENSKMNYRAWNHRCWLVSYMSQAQVLIELQNTRDWAVLHVADNSSFHYRTRLLLRAAKSVQDNHCPEGLLDAGFHKFWKEELDWVEVLIRRYVGREALWLYRRFLSLFWITHLTSDGQTTLDHSLCKSSEIEDIDKFINDELKLLHSCTIIPDNEFEDYEAQMIYSTSYVMWLAKQMPMHFRIQLQKNSQYQALELLIRKSGKSFLWDSFI